MKPYMISFGAPFIFVAMYLVLNMTSKDDRLPVAIVMCVVIILCSVIGLIGFYLSDDDADETRNLNKQIVKLRIELDEARRIIDEKEKIIVNLSAQTDDSPKQGFSQNMTMQ